MARYVVAGATGRVGSVVASELLKHGQDVTVILRSEAHGHDWEARGASVARGALDDRSFVARAVRGASGFFTLLPENVPPDDFHPARRRMADAIAGAVNDGDVPHVVMLSALAAILPDGNGPAQDLHYCEQQLRAHARQLTVLRACYFQDNVAGVLPVAMHAGIYPNFFASADTPIPMIATSDIGRFAAHTLMAPANRHETIDLLGPLYSVREIARAIGTALDREVRVVDVPPERHRDSLVEAGVPPPIASAVAELFAAFNAGLISPRGDRQVACTTTIEEIVGRAAGAARLTA